MAHDNFARCLAITLRWEGGYSNHPDDPGGPTMRGIIQREYDAWRTKQGKSRRSVRLIEEGELQAIYRNEYWDAMDCDALPAGFDLCVFDAAVNSGVGRAREWYARARDIDGFCDARLAFLQRLGRLWRVFGAGWSRRVAGIRADAHAMAGGPGTQEFTDRSLHAGMKGEAVRRLQEQLRALGYPAGAVDGVFGEQTYRAVILFQHDNDLKGNPGTWLPEYDQTLESAEPMLPKRQDVTHKDLEAAGDRPVKRLNLMQRVFAWLFGTTAVAQTFEGESLLDRIHGARSAFEPLRDMLDWAAGNRLLIVAVGCVGMIALVRALRADHVAAYRNFDYQGPPQAAPGCPKAEPIS